MRHKKLLLLALLLLGFGLTDLQAQKIYVKGKNMIITEFSLTTVNAVNFSDLNLIVQKKNGSSPMFLINGLSSINFNPATGISTEKKEKASLLVYPNPVTDVLNIQMEADAGRLATVEILSMDGRVVYTRKTTIPGTSFQVNTASLKQGLYWCRIINEKNIETVKFSKQ